MKKNKDLELLKEFKGTSGWSYQELSNHLRVHYQTVVSWFSGERNPSPRMVKRIQKFLRSIEKSRPSGDLKR